MSLNAQRFTRSHKHEVITGNFAPMPLFTPRQLALQDVVKAANALPRYGVMVLARSGFGEPSIQPSLTHVTKAGWSGRKYQVLVTPCFS